VPRPGGASARKEFQVHEAGYEFRAVIVLLLTGALCLVWAIPPEESQPQMPRPVLADGSQWPDLQVQNRAGRVIYQWSARASTEGRR
jgi:hypothetical protein